MSAYPVCFAYKAMATVRLQTASQERTAAVTGLQALQMCDEKAKCSLHVGLTQVHVNL